MQNLFSTETQKLSTTPIVAVDCSGSTRTPFTEPTTYGTVDSTKPSVFQKLREIIEKLPETQFRLIFWCSDQESLFAKSQFFKKGCYTLPFVVKKETLKQTFTHVEKQIIDSCLTFPHLVFEELLNPSLAGWFSPTEPTKIYFATDGDIGYGSIPSYELSTLKQKLANGIKNIFAKYNTQIYIITLEPKNVDYSNSEILKFTAGNAVYNVIQENKLTNYVSSFTSYSLNNLQGFVHMSKIIVPKGFIGFGNQYFSQLKTREFINYISGEISKTGEEDKLLEIVQKLATTISQLSKDKPVSVREGILNTFCNLFNNTPLDPMFVKFILTEAVNNENQGSANVFAMYRAQLKDLYKQATELIFKGVKDAIGASNSFITFPVNNIIVYGSGRLVKDDCGGMGKKVFPQGGVKVGKMILPVFPQEYSFSNMNRQCLRQWTRSVIAKLYNVDQMGDIVIYLVMGLNVLIHISDAPKNVKDSFRNLSTVMLGKKRMNTDITELERLEEGNPPVPNSGKIEDFFKIINQIQRILPALAGFSSFSLWYAMCLSLGNEKVISTQYPHCIEDLGKDSLTKENILERIKEKVNTTFVCVELNDLSSLDYSCLITLEDTSRVGGYRIMPHNLNEINNQACSPIYVFSDAGFEQMVSSPERSVCPICYSSLSRNDFEKVGAKPSLVDSNNNIFEGVQNIFSTNVSVAPAVIPNTKKGTIVFTKGVVGCGKTTFCEALVKHLQETPDTFALSTGTDKFCKNGIPTNQAINLVKEELQDVFNRQEKNIIVIIDTCGERDNAKDVFGCDFSSWKKLVVFPNLIDKKPENLQLYLAWSLRNVLQRGACSENCNFYLNPVGASLRVCIDVHAKKAKNLFGKNTVTPSVSGNNVSDDIQSLSEKANKYVDMLTHIDDQVKDILKKL